MENMIQNLFKASTRKPQGRKVWSVDLETVWLPFFTATNTDGVTRIAHEALGAPLRLAYNPDGAVKFSKSGKPIIKVAKDIADNVKLVRENFVSGLMDYTHAIVTSKPDDYKAMIVAAQKAGKTIIDKDNKALSNAINELVAQAVAQAEAMEKAEAVAQAVAPTETRELVTA